MNEHSERIRVTHWESKYHETQHQKPIRQNGMNLLSYIIVCLILSEVLSLLIPKWRNTGDIETRLVNMAFFYGPLVIYFLLNLTILVVGLLTFIRTKYPGFLFELLISLQQVIIIPLVFYFIFIQPSFIFASSFFFGSFILLVIQYPLLKKPLFWEKGHFQNQLSYYDQRRDLVLIQSVKVSEFNDGYSSRPIFKSFSERIQQNSNVDQIKNSIMEFGYFLAKKGDLIGIENQGDIIRLNLRTALLQKDDLFNPSVFIRKCINVVKKEDLTSISFNFKNNEVSFKINKFDYSYLDNITYLSLGERLLNNFNLALEYFFENDFTASYKMLFGVSSKF